MRAIKKDATKAENAMAAVLRDSKNKGGHDSDLNSENSDYDSEEDEESSD